ncbi:ATPase [Vibrio atypicus]|uniref:Dph6-related ATP pyrophosphatase n=1 Tax=Vibrio atypicus TaxID=558271 RepID=UPI0013572B23|nr:ATPase [Vibrio atypicus]
MKKNVIISWSSGKDSALTLERLQKDPNYNVVGLYTSYVKHEVPFQATPLYVLDLQAQLLRLPLIKIELPEIFPSNDLYQSTIVKALKQSHLTIDAVAFGDMFCNGIAEYRRSYIEPAGWECVFPLMGEETKQLANEINERGIQTLVVTVDRDVLSEEFCGRWFNNTLISELPISIDPCGENGEFHTLVTHTESFQGHLELKLTHIERGERFSYQRYTAKRLPNNLL